MKCGTQEQQLPGKNEQTDLSVREAGTVLFQPEDAAAAPAPASHNDEKVRGPPPLVVVVVVVVARAAVAAVAVTVDLLCAEA